MHISLACNKIIYVEKYLLGVSIKDNITKYTL